MTAREWRAWRLLLGVLILGLGCRSASHAGSRTDDVRPPAVAGQFYSGAAEELGAAIDAWMRNARPPAVGRPIALVLPHAGYVYCGKIMADGYRAARDQGYDAVVVLATNHTTASYRRVAIYPGRGLRTPLGVAEIDGSLVDRLVAECGPDCALDAAVHAAEHSLEVQVPFIQRVFPGVKIMPAIVGDPDLGLCRRFGEALARALQGRRALIVASSDLSHYHGAQDAERVDRATLEAVARLDPAGFQQTARAALRRGVPGLVTAACGEAPILAAIFAAKNLGATRGTILSYTHSGQTILGDSSRVVGYGAAAFTADQTGGATIQTPRASLATSGVYDQGQRRRLLAVARESIESALKRQNTTRPPCETALMLPRGVFVTLKKDGDLRGCIGRIIPDTQDELCPLVAAMARAAAFEDPRFRPLTRGELEMIEIEISVLTPLQRVAGAADIVAGRDGVLLRRDGHSAVFLPQVAPDQGWGRDEMLDHLCLKGGLRPGCWKDAELSIFQAEVFNEAEARRAASSPRL